MANELDKVLAQAYKQHKNVMDKAAIKMSKEHQREMDKAAIKTWNGSGHKVKGAFHCADIKQMAKDLMQTEKALKMLLELCLERADNDDDRAEILILLDECDTRLGEYDRLLS